MSISRRELFRYAAIGSGAVWLSAVTAPGVAQGREVLGTIVDYSADVPSPQSIRAAGHIGAIRYVSVRRPGAEWMLAKPLTEDEATDLTDSGLEVVSCYQFGKADTTDWRGGFDAGAARLLRGYGVEATHSVLLLRIKGVTIAEWSHNGSCRMWKRGNRAAPKLYEPEYTRSELTDGCDFRQTHVGADQGRWQNYVAALLQGETRVRISSASYMPKRGKTW